MASFGRRVAVTYGTFVVANWASNFILYPDKKLDYGFLNRLVGRPVNNEWWGTRTEHILGIALPLAIADHASIDLWNKHLLKRFGMKGPLSFTGTPGPFLLHAISFAFVGIMAYVGLDAAFNPAHENNRKKAVTSKVYPELTGVQTMWVLGTSSQACAALFSRPVPHGSLPGLIPPILAFTTVKGFGMPWPWHNNLTAYEKKLNEPQFTALRITSSASLDSGRATAELK